ncbi:MAG: hypothetical protein J1E59_09040 [Treponema sp.]|nr:hypothetical protein [Treponema sp.]
MLFAAKGTSFPQENSVSKAEPCGKMRAVRANKNSVSSAMRCDVSRASRCDEAMKELLNAEIASWRQQKNF